MNCDCDIHTIRVLPLPVPLLSFDFTSFILFENRPLARSLNFRVFRSLLLGRKSHTDVKRRLIDIMVFVAV